MPRNPNKVACTRGSPEEFEAFGSLRDPLNGGNTRHHFGEILFIAFAGVLGGVRSCEMMEEFADLREPWLRKWLQLPNGIPPDNTFSLVFQAIEPTASNHSIAAHLEALGMGKVAGPTKGAWSAATERITQLSGHICRIPFVHGRACLWEGS